MQLKLQRCYDDPLLPVLCASIQPCPQSLRAPKRFICSGAGGSIYVRYGLSSSGRKKTALKLASAFSLPLYTMPYVLQCVRLLQMRV